MAKKKTLTQPQVQEIADKLHGTCDNVYLLVRRLHGLTVGDEFFDRLRKETSLFRCEQCNEWQLLENEDPDTDNWCAGCVNEIDEDGDWEEE